MFIREYSADYYVVVLLGKWLRLKSRNPSFMSASKGILIKHILNVVKTHLTSFKASKLALKFVSKLHRKLAKAYQIPGNSKLIFSFL